jgi:hypothetical protein
MLTRQRSECLFLQRLPPCKTGLSINAWKLFFCLMFSDLLNSICKVPRLRPFVLIREMYRWREFRALVEWILTGEIPSSRRQTRLSVTLFNTSLTWADVGSNSNLRSGRLGKGTASVAASSSYTNLLSATQNGRKSMKQVNPSASTLWPPTSDLWPRCAAVLWYFEVTPCSLTSGYQVLEGGTTSFSERASVFTILRFN